MSNCATTLIIRFRVPVEMISTFNFVRRRATLEHELLMKKIIRFHCRARRRLATDAKDHHEALGPSVEELPMGL